jgi:hypothetical protein
MALNAQILLSILAHESDSGDISRTLRATPTTYALAFTDGTGANQAQVVWSDSRTVTAAADYDFLNASALTDDRGAVSFTAIKAIYIRSTGSVTMAVSFSGVIGETSLPPGAAFFFSRADAAGWSAGEITVFNPNALDATYEIILIGEGTIT